VSGTETTPSPIDKDQPSIRVVHKLFGLPTDYYKKTKAQAAELGIKDRDFKLAVFEGAAAKLISARETRRLYAAIGKIPTLDELTELNSNLEANLSPALVEPFSVETWMVCIEKKRVKIDSRHREGYITRCLFRTPIEPQLARNRQEARELVVKQIGVDDPSILEQSDIWDEEDYRRIRLASVLSIKHGKIIDQWLHEGNPFPPELVFGGAVPEKVNF
jgi:hypothetical protein